MKQDLPEPDTDSQPIYVSEEVLEILFSPSRRYRAIITKDREGLLRIHRDYWCTSDYEYIGEGYWCQNDTLATITDTIESARKLAQEALDQTGDRAPQTTQPNKAE
ncbi:hypothetical protein [Haloferula sp. A504]|uniref:hypothetical protein n=1 Tax=Haloferula sp. A504 TaxID=3373601 RepID=UPI0031C56F0B|nr:hypothetical protein [Verrucomicrobiaceae bacterium E54]